jgi:hypothetical protein
MPERELTDEEIEDLEREIEVPDQLVAIRYTCFKYNVLHCRRSEIERALAFLLDEARPGSTYHRHTELPYDARTQALRVYGAAYDGTELSQIMYLHNDPSTTKAPTLYLPPA